MSNSLAVTFRRWARRSDCCGWLWASLGWVFGRIGASSARPPPKEYLAPYEMRVRERGTGAGVVGCSCWQSLLCWLLLLLGTRGQAGRLDIVAGRYRLPAILTASVPPPLPPRAADGVGRLAHERAVLGAGAGRQVCVRLVCHHEDAGGAHPGALEPGLAEHRDRKHLRQRVGVKGLRSELEGAGAGVLRLGVCMEDVFGSSIGHSDTGFTGPSAHPPLTTPSQSSLPLPGPGSAPHNCSKDTGIPKPDGDIILCIARCMPGFIVMANDMQVRRSMHCAVQHGRIICSMGGGNARQRVTDGQEAVASIAGGPLCSISL